MEIGMSSSFYVYVGPFLKLKINKIEVSKKGGFGCPDWIAGKGCKGFETKVAMPSGDAKFCPYCGLELVEIIRKIPEKVVDIYHLLESKYEDSLFQCYIGDFDKREYEHWIPNHYYPKRILTFSKGEEEIEVLDIDKEEEIKWFNERYKNELALIKEAAGEDAQIMWGILSYYH
jgi:hypothetical protein